MIKTTTRSTLATILLAGFAVANAAPVELEYQGFVSGSKNGTIFGPEVGAQRSVAAGQFLFDVKDDPFNVLSETELQAFCIDVTEWLVTGQDVTYEFVAAESSGYLSDNVLANIAWLYDNKSANLGSALNDAAFQLSVWEAVYDDSPLSLLDGTNGGSFWSNSFSGAQSIAESGLADLTAASPSASYTSSMYDFFVLLPSHPVDNQALIVARPIPEPSVIALLGLGFAVFGFSRTRRAGR
jgi:hypothetical protein